MAISSLAVLAWGGACVAPGALLFGRLTGSQRRGTPLRPKASREEGHVGPLRGARRDLGTAVAEFRQTGRANAPPKQFEDWTDYTQYALGVENYTRGPREEREERLGRTFYAFTERKRSLGIDFGPQFTGLALSLGGVNSMPLGTLQTGTDWKETALKVVQIASTRRAKDIVVGQPLEKDGSEGRISLLVRHFSQLVADASLLMLGGNTTVYMWDERFSTTYAAMRLVVRPNFEGGAFKNWLDGQRGLDFGRKGLLDAEAARAILEHFLAKDPRTEVLNKERAERVPPSKEACRAYLQWKRQPRLRARRPEEPAGPGREAWEWDDLHREELRQTPEEYMRQADDFEKYMRGMNHFGDRRYEIPARKEMERKERRRASYIRKLQDENPLQEAFRAAMGREGDDRVYKGLRIKGDEWRFPKKKKPKDETKE